MTEELTSPVVYQGTQQPEQDEQLLQRQRLLQDEAQSVLKELNLVELLAMSKIRLKVASFRTRQKYLHSQKVVEIVGLLPRWFNH